MNTGEAETESRDNRVAIGWREANELRISVGAGHEIVLFRCKNSENGVGSFLGIGW